MSKLSLKTASTDELANRLTRWSRWVYRQQIEPLGYPRCSCLVKIEFMGARVGPIQYENELAPTKNDASATDAMINHLPDCDKGILMAHYVWRRHNGKRKAVNEKIRLLGLSRATYYRMVSEAKGRLRYLLDV